MKDIDVMDQRRICFDPDRVDEAEIPQMAIIVILNNGVLGEASSIRGAVSLIAGDGYLVLKSPLEEWNTRVSIARTESMFAISRDIFAEVYDERHGIIHNNYGADPENPDYEIDEEDEEPIKIHVENDKVLLLSLARVGAIRLLEREDSYQFRPHEGWNNIKQNPSLKCCKNCLLKIENYEDVMLTCPVYKASRKPTDGSDCSSYTLPMDEGSRRYKGGEYIDVVKEYDVERLIRFFM